MLLLRNSMHAISPMRAAALLFFTATFIMPAVDRIEYICVYRVHQEMHTFIDSICTMGKLAYNELLLNMMNDQKIVNPKISPHLRSKHATKKRCLIY